MLMFTFKFIKRYVSQPTFSSQLASPTGMVVNETPPVVSTIKFVADFVVFAGTPGSVVTITFPIPEDGYC